MIDRHYGHLARDGTALLEQKWDLIFFTRSPPVGKIIHQAAAKNLTPAGGHDEAVGEGA
jgi:acyl-CoA reductase-like NAD-dependent aldehyde dehydrogenase